MTQHIPTFLQDCTTVTADGSLVSFDELEGLYLYWCSTRSEAPLDVEVLAEALASRGVDRTLRHGVEYAEGLVLTGSVMAEFILTCDFSGVWGQPDPWDLAPAQDVATAS
ncbi:hypothetical protein FJV46_03805 [Arthrobacter agilis]|uniref:hypothetical protein n=1 Tax=Arthrobacter agilis TaxID=37921 RepID=UPI000B355B24|nr:hypothetical protein [Arthrobacter agilis]OUM41460.1 hypothetical protein B8W74_11235 [Arthrobacter agilis]PPB46209.1 hypothetical protein CI784_07655 [Arthrobacter agilis]TPV26964.1 hypothetical protein FJV46_03805 [Arthrobacter agilis]VDR32902.1 Uncharacterised protein [Arthrobacter agilis]